jgi:urease accessory protein
VGGITTATIIMTMITVMTGMCTARTAVTGTATMNERTLYRLMAWLSPSYPVGAFSYSHGIEWLVETGDIRDGRTLTQWISHILRHGSGRNDAIFFAHAHRAVTEKHEAALMNIVELAGASVASAERHLETTAQGRAFAETTAKTWVSSTLDRLLADDDRMIAYPVAVAIAAADHGIDLPSALAAYLHAFAANLVSAGVRLVPLGQTAGQIAITRLEVQVAEAVTVGIETPLEDIGGAAFLMDMAAMKHETQYTRLFRS